MNINELDFNRMHLAPKPVQFLLALLLAVLMVVGGYFLMFQEQYQTFEDAKAQEETLKSEYSALAAKVVGLQVLERELTDIESSIQSLIKQLPVSSEIPTLIQELYQAAARNRLTMNTVIPQPAVSEDANIERLPFTISVVGTFEELSQFLRDIGKMSRIVTLSSINVGPPDEVGGMQEKEKGRNKDKLLLRAVASTYKAVDAPPQAASDAAASSASEAQ